MDGIYCTGVGYDYGHSGEICVIACMIVGESCRRTVGLENGQNYKVEWVLCLYLSYLWPGARCGCHAGQTFAFLSKIDQAVAFSYQVCPC